jgi:hypothetical protein
VVTGEARLTGDLFQSEGMAVIAVDKCASAAELLIRLLINDEFIFS